MQAGLTLAPGSVFARDFRIERPLAAGGMGAVYVAVQMSTGRRRALKLMHPSLAADEGARRRFLLEARVGARIASDHLVEVHAAGVDEETNAPYLVMDLLEGEDLETRLDRAGPMTKDEVRELFRQMCHALGAAHGLGIVHRDLKPANVFLATHKRVAGPPFEVKILDFGIAKLTQGSSTMRSSTVPGSVMGTPLWMAPEQADGHAVAATADVWALGLILYNVLTGRPFWRTANAPDAALTEVFREILIDAIPSPRERARAQGVEFPAVLEPVFRGSVVRDPAVRYADATIFLRALDAALAGATFVPPPRSDERLALANTVASDPDLALACTVASEPELELAVEPSRFRERPPSASAATLEPPPRVERPPPIAVTRPALAEPERTPIPFLPLAIGGLVLAGIVGFVAQRALSGGFYAARCRLCTIEAGTHANGPMPLREIRHSVEARFPEIDKRCIKEAPHAGHVTLKFTVKDGVVRERPGYSPVNDTTLCIAQTMSSLGVGPPGQRILALGAVAEVEGATQVTYALDFDPAQ